MYLSDNVVTLIIFGGTEILLPGNIQTGGKQQAWHDMLQIIWM